MPRATVSEGVELEYEIIGDPDAEPILLIMGIGAQLVHWPLGFCERLAKHGFSVIRFDNRDIGKSTWLDHLPVPPPTTSMVRAMFRLPVDAPYTLSDMALDGVGLLDHLGLERAHVVGMSMGGMIAQHMAIEHAARLSSVTSIMSTPGNTRNTLRIKPHALRALFQPPPRDRDEAQDRIVRFFRAVGGSLPLDEPALREIGAVAFDRGMHPAGFGRQWGAILASGSRLNALRTVNLPALVIHGTEDPLVPPQAGVATAEAIARARLELIEGMGHFLSHVLWDRIVDAIADLAHFASPGGSPRKVARAG